MKVILREEVENLGNAGDLVNVKPGYARNFLFPRQLAIRADERNVKALEHSRKVMERRRDKLAAEAGAAAKTVEAIGRVVVTKACGPEGKLFGSVTTAEIAGLLTERGVAIERRQIDLAEPLKALGDYDVGVKLGQGVLATVKVSVEPDAASMELIAKAAAEAAAAPAEVAEA
jgi:large subunit ribosomal protein L9